MALILVGIMPVGFEDEYVWYTTVGEQRRHNIHIHEGVTENDFVTLRTRRHLGDVAPRESELAK